MEVLKEEYKDTKIGRIPKDWGVCKIGQIANCFGGTTPSTTVVEYWNGDIPWLSVVDFNGSSCQF